MNNKPETCNGCPMQNIGEGYVNGEGPKDSKLCIVGEAPGAEEVQSGRPFVGGSGRILDSWLSKAGVARGETRVDNIMRCRPPQNKIPKSFDPIGCAQRHLLPELRSAKHNALLLLGETPLSAIVGLEGITKRRGSIYNTPYGKCVPTLHPAFIMRQQKLWSVCVADVRRAKEQSSFADYRPPTHQMNLFPTVADLQAYDPGEYLAFDIENTMDDYLNSGLICCGFFNGTSALCVPWLKQGGMEYWSAEDKSVVIQEMNRLLSGPSKKILQNMMHDVMHLTGLGFVINNVWFDTMLAHHLLYAELPHKLDFITSVHTEVPYYKDEVKGDVGFLKLPDKILRNYNLLDCIATYLAAFDMLPILNKRGL